MKLLWVIPVLAGGGMFLQNQELRYSPGTTRYEQVLTTSGSPDPSGSAVQMHSRMLLTASLAAVTGQPDSLAVVITVDSASVTAGGLLAGQIAAVPPGTSISRTMSRRGGIPRGGANANVRGGGQASPLTEVVNALFPTIAAGARVGSAWEDTLPLATLGGPGSMGALSGMLSGQILRSVIVARDTTFEGQPAWKLNVGTEVTAAAARQANPVQVEASGGGSGFILVSKSGVLLYSTESTAIALNIRMGGATSPPLSIETNTTRTVRRIQ